MANMHFDHMSVAIVIGVYIIIGVVWSMYKWKRRVSYAVEHIIDTIRGLNYSDSARFTDGNALLQYIKGTKIWFDDLDDGMREFLVAAIRSVYTRTQYSAFGRCHKSIRQIMYGEFNYENYKLAHRKEEFDELFGGSLDGLIYSLSPSISEQKFSMFLFVIFWPVSAIKYIFMEFLYDIWNKFWGELQKMYQYITKMIVRSIIKKMDI